jgi:hypothetical protein
MVHVFDSNLNGFEHGLTGVPVAWATAVADDYVGPTREPMRASRLRNERSLSRRASHGRREHASSRETDAELRSIRRSMR